MLLSSFAFNHDIVNVYLDRVAYQRFEDFSHQSLIRGASVFESEWHDFVAIEAVCVMNAVFLRHPETWEFDSPFALFLWYHYYICQPIRIRYLSDESGFQQFVNFILDNSLSIRVKASNLLSNGSGCWKDVKLVRGDRGMNSLHIRMCPCEDVMVASKDILYALGSATGGSLSAGPNNCYWSCAMLGSGGDASSWLACFTCYLIALRAANWLPYKWAPVDIVYDSLGGDWGPRGPRVMMLRCVPSSSI
ncbi:hypothetical protein CK203_070424 [Vitis vinifera]|uniref:Uncharacterized protein n=1 Tax=Vitis vinifera TaxID=29760 RepID=A0A438FAV9_VITVI|nr:hypothetical protein CK203_070424 [Vitis vinifera]